MRIHLHDTRGYTTHEIGIRYLQGVGLEIMLWYRHIQILFDRRS